MFGKWIAAMVSGVWAVAASCAQVQWFDGQQEKMAWVNDATGEVSLELGGLSRRLAHAFSVVTEPGKAVAVAQSLKDLGWVVMPSPLPDKLYVRMAADQVLQATERLRSVNGIAHVQLQWERRVALPQVVH